MKDAIATQVSAIRYDINTAQDVYDLKKADKLLDFAATVWNRGGFAESVKELESLIVTRARDMLSGEEEYMASLRKNASTRWSTEKEIRLLHDLIMSLS